MKKIWCILFFILLVPSHVSADTVNAGIVQGLWFSQQPIFVGDTVRIYVAVQNNTEADLTARVSFFDNNDRFGRMNINALEGRIVEAWTDWTPRHGEHTLQATLTEITLSDLGETIAVASTSAALAEKIVFIDYDTDGDDIGDMIDLDDDNDGMRDDDEISNGTDPLVPDQNTSPESAKIITEKDIKKSPSANNDGSEDRTNTNTSGLEQYLAESPARSALASITETIEATKEKVDAYRKRRSEEISASTTTASDKPNTDMLVISDLNETTETVGTITRSVDESPSWWQKTLTLVVSLVTTLFNTIFTLILTGLSMALGHPILLQIALLLLILLILIRVSKNFAGRKSKP